MIKLSNNPVNNRQKWKWTSLNESRGKDIQKVINDHQDWWPLTERQVYYRLISSDLIGGPHWYKHGNIEFETVDIYPALCRTLKWLRIENKVPWEAIIDEHRIVTDKIGFENIDHFINQELELFLTGYRRCLAEKQQYYVEVWIEKAALFHIVKPIADMFCRRTVVGKGYNSMSFQAEFYNRATDALMREQKPIILYFGDWDPSGVDMPYAIIKTLQDELGLTGIEIYRCGINQEHFRAVKAKPVPVKQSDPRSKKFIKQYGQTAYELDAFHPESLQKLVKSCLEKFTDMNQLTDDLQNEKIDQQKLGNLRLKAKKFIREMVNQ